MILNLMKKNPKPPVYTITVNITNGSYSGDTTVALGSTATGVVTPDSGYMLTGVTITTDAGAAVSVTFDTTTGVVTFTPQTALSGEGFTASGTCAPNLYAISTTVENGTYTGAISVFYGSSAIVTITPSSGYQLPSSISVTNATYTYDDTTGVVTVTPTGAGTITISASCEAIPATYTINLRADDGYEGVPGHAPDGYVKYRVNGSTVGMITTYGVSTTLTNVGQLEINCNYTGGFINELRDANGDVIAELEYSGDVWVDVSEYLPTIATEPYVVIYCEG